MQEFKMIKMHFSTDRHKVHLFEDPITFFEFIAKGNTSYMLLGIGWNELNKHFLAGSTVTELNHQCNQLICDFSDVI